MSLLTSFLAGGGDLLANDRYGLWKMTSAFAVPRITQVGVSNNRFTFDTVLSGSFPDFNTTTHKLVVTKRGIYALGWDGPLSVVDSFGGAHRAAIMRITTNSIVGAADFIGIQQAISTTGAFTSVFGVSGTTFLDVG